MNKKTELLVAPKNLAELQLLSEVGAGAFVVGDACFAQCVRGSFKKKDLEESVNLAHLLEKKIYLLVDAIFSNALLAEFEIYLKSIQHLIFDAIRVADLGAYMLIKQIMPDTPIHFVDAMMLTNHYTVNYWANKGVKRIRLAHELTYDEVLEVKKSTISEIEVLVQGAPLMFTSRRKLVDNYLDFKRTIGKDVTIAKNGNFLFDEERDLYYPIVENKHGTHIYGGCDVCMIDDLVGLLEAHIDALYIESFTYETQDLAKIVKLYKMAIELVTDDSDKYSKVGSALYHEVEKLCPYSRRIDRGFYYKPTIYKNK